MSDCTPKKAGETSSRILTSQRFTLTKPMDFVVDGDPEYYRESIAAGDDKTISSSEFKGDFTCWHGETKAELGDCSKFLICNRGRFQQFSCSNDQVRLRNSISLRKCGSSHYNGKISALDNLGNNTLKFSFDVSVLCLRRFFITEESSYCRT